MKFISYVFLFIFLMGSVYAIGNCTEGNDFVFNDDVVICSAGCIWQDWRAPETYYACNDSVVCSFTGMYVNNSVIVFEKNMTLLDNHFEYNLSEDLDLPDETANLSGIMTGEFNCYHKEKGDERSVHFFFSMGHEPTITTSGGGGFSSAPLSTAFVKGDEFLLKALEDIKKNMVRFFLIVFFIFAIFMLIFTEWRNGRNRKLAKELSKFISGGKSGK